MKFAKTLLVAAALVASVGANAQSFSTMAAPASGNYYAPVYTVDFGTAYTASTTIPSVQLAPLGDTNTFLVVQPEGQATLNLGGATSFSFLWGSPDWDNQISINGGAFIRGIDLFTSLGYPSLTNGDNANTQWFTITADSNAPALNTLTLQTGVIAFEVAVVPEPETYALMLAGLGAMAFVARRRRNV